MQSECIVVDQQCRGSKGQAEIEGYMSISDEEAHHRVHHGVEHAKALAVHHRLVIDLACLHSGTGLAALSLLQGHSLPVVAYIIKLFLPFPFTWPFQQLGHSDGLRYPAM